VAICITEGIAQDGSKNDPAEIESEFVSKQAKLWKSYSKGNDNAYQERASYNKEFFSRYGFKVQDWQGVVKKDEDGNFNISFKLKGFEVDFEHESGTDNKDLAKDIINGQSVIFSGNVIPDDEKGIAETSITRTGSMENPEYVVIFNTIAALNVQSRAANRPSKTSFLPQNFSATFKGRHPEDVLVMPAKGYYSGDTLTVFESDWSITVKHGKFYSVKEKIVSRNYTGPDYETNFPVRKTTIVSDGRDSTLAKLEVSWTNSSNRALPDQYFTFLVEIIKDSSTSQYSLVLKKSSEPSSDLMFFYRSADVILRKDILPKEQSGEEKAVSTSTENSGPFYEVKPSDQDGQFFATTSDAADAMALSYAMGDASFLINLINSKEITYVKGGSVVQFLRRDSFRGASVLYVKLNERESGWMMEDALQIVIQ
jgi:hypothetical protein